MIRQAHELVRHPDALECVLVLAAGIVWLLYLTPRSGGFHDPSTALTAAAFLPAAIVVRPWVRVPGWLLALVAWAVAGSVVVLIVTPTGWQQADSPAGQVLGLLAVVIACGFGHTAARRRAVLLVLLLAVAVQFLPAWTAWHGSGDPNVLMVGTFYWHNQLGIWMTALALIAGAHAVGGDGRSRALGAAMAMLAVPSVVLTTSRTCLALLALGWLALLPLALRGRRSGLLPWTAIPAGGALVLLLLTSSLFFAKPWSGLSAVQGEANNPGSLGNRGTSSLATNGGDRTRWTSAALTTWSEHPLVGGGFGSFRFTVGQHVPVGSNVSAFVHNGYAEALTSGGVTFGLPVIGIWLAIAAAAVRAFWQSLRPLHPERGTLTGFSLATAVLLLHSAVDFDWHYPSLAVLLGVAGGTLIRSRAEGQTGRTRLALSTGVLVVATAFVATASLVEHHGRSIVMGSRPYTAQQLLDARLPGADDPRLDLAALQACLQPDGSLAVPRDVAERAVSVSGRAAQLDPALRTLRDNVSAALRG
jgi:hypothetical protein